MMLERGLVLCLLVSTGFLLLSCGGGPPPPHEPAGQVVAPLDAGVIERLTGLSPTAQDGEYKISVPHHELPVEVDGFPIVPAMGLTTWAAFAPAPEGATVMGDLVLLESEIGPVQRELLASGLTVSALHNHFVRDVPKVMFMHIHGRGPLEELARGVASTLSRISELRAPLQSNPRIAQSNLDTARIESRLGHSGNLSGGVFKITVGRPAIDLRHHGLSVSTFMGFNSWMAFQGTEERAAVAGDFAMTADEVPAVIQTLAAREIEVVAMHSHMLGEEPTIYFLHFWGVAPLEELLEGLHAALQVTP